MIVAMQIIQIILSITVAALLLIQAKGGGLGSIFGGSGGVYRTRRGVEKTMHQATIVLIILFFVNALATVILVG